MYFTVEVYRGMMMFFSALARFWVFVDGGRQPIDAVFHLRQFGGQLFTRSNLMYASSTSELEYIKP